MMDDLACFLKVKGHAELHGLLRIRKGAEVRVAVGYAYVPAQSWTIPTSAAFVQRGGESLLVC